LGGKCAFFLAFDCIFNHSDERQGTRLLLKQREKQNAQFFLSFPERGCQRAREIERYLAENWRMRKSDCLCLFVFSFSVLSQLDQMARVVKKADSSRRSRGKNEVKIFQKRDFFPPSR